jgi:hypothetical protein
LWTKTGIKLVPITEKDDWVLTVAQSPNQSVVAIGTNDGLVEVYRLNFTLVHGLYQVSQKSIFDPLRINMLIVIL